MKILKLFLILSMLTFGGCEPYSQKEAKPVVSPSEVQEEKTVTPPKPVEYSVEAKEPDNQKPFKKFYVYDDKGSRQNHYVPSGFMPNGKCLKMNDRWMENCQSGKSCIKVIYDIECSIEDHNWAGVYWLNPPNNWGSRKGGFNLTGATKLTFWAKGENGGERIEEFKIGGISGDYPDTDMAMIGPVILSKEWREYSIDLRGKDLSYISGGFLWSTTADVNPETCTFYLDKIFYE